MSDVVDLLKENERLKRIVLSHKDRILEIRLSEENRCYLKKLIEDEDKK